MALQTLSCADVLNIHAALVSHFAEAGEPIFPPGVKNLGMLESAVGRQMTGSGNHLKYSEVSSNAATLVYGICMNHPFHNGNKRTALVTLLVHMDRNGFIPKAELTHNEIYNLMLYLAAHLLVDSRKVLSGGRVAVAEAEGKVVRLSADEEVSILADWIRRRFRCEDKNEHPLTFRQVRRILARYGYRFGSPSHNFIDVIRDEQVEMRGFLGLGRPRIEKRTQRVVQLSYAGEGEVIRVDGIRKIRRACHLLPEDGVDSRSFYDGEARVDYFINEYRNILKKLARA